MHVISRDAASGCPLCDPRRKPPSWKTCMWIDRFLYTIVAIVMPVALYKSFFCHALPFADQRLSKKKKEGERERKSARYFFPITFVDDFFAVITFNFVYSKNMSLLVT